MQKSNQRGTLYIVATPIGNLRDITQRALEVLNAVDLIAAEDTRHSQALLQHYHINTPLISLHEFNESKRIGLLLSRLEQGNNIALISDAGTPLISDPGYLLVQAVRAAAMTVTPIPGCCAAIAALSAAGLPTESFIFAGFLSSKAGERKQRLESLRTQPATLIFYEAPHRILKLLQDIMGIFEEKRRIVLVKELTKTFETFFAGTAAEVYNWLKADPYHQKGEFVVLVEGASLEKNSEIPQEAQRILALLCDELPLKQAALLTAKITGVKKNVLYNFAVKQHY
ncbi:MAG TPA: 16S rRNA (cytidine(1402)-2'-O)-methyltransferase [Gammaproteobacteria bacterium]|nr:16S rRNA (cytidine(1402)-2'-O)-methyltransferase [Gammaproteobacteria bacterium]